LLRKEIGIKTGGGKAFGCVKWVHVAETVRREETLSLDQGNRSSALPPRFPLWRDGADNITVHEEGGKKRINCSMQLLNDIVH